MLRSNERREGMALAIFGLWRNWAVATGLLTVLSVLAPIVPLEWLALINVVFFFVLKWIRSELYKRDVPSCPRLLQQVSVVMVLAAVALAVLYLFGHKGNAHEINGQPYSLNTPVIAILITAPGAAIVTLLYLARRSESLVCQQCKMRYGNVVEHGFIGDLFRKEWRYQTRVLFILSLGLSVVEWGYYLLHYININLNSADKFFFIWMPLVVYVLSLIYLGIRYYSLWVYYCQNDEGHLVERPGTTEWRFLVIAGDRILLTEKEGRDEGDMNRLDTPVVVHTAYRERDDLNEAIRLFKENTGIPDAEIKLAYTSPDRLTYQNIFHYFAFLSSPAMVGTVGGKWLTWGNILQLTQRRSVSRELVSELRRIYNIAMAWKTYDMNGRRLYRIKHYRPTFRLRDLRNWDVDYNDCRWLRVAYDNEDKFWYPLRRLFVRTIGVKGKGG